MARDVAATIGTIAGAGVALSLQFGLERLNRNLRTRLPIPIADDEVVGRWAAEAVEIEQDDSGVALAIVAIIWLKRS